MGQGLRTSVGRGGWYWPFCRGGVLLLRPGAVAMVGSTIERLGRRQKVRNRPRIGGIRSLNIWGPGTARCGLLYGEASGRDTLWYNKCSVVKAIDK